MRLKIATFVVKVMDGKYAMFILTLCTVVTLWMADAAYDAWYHEYPNLTFWQTVITNVPRREIEQRGIAAIGVLVWGYCMNKLNKIKR